MFELAGTLAGLRRRARGLVLGYVAKGALGAGLALGTVTAAVLMLFFAAYLALARVLDPALAALIPAAVVLGGMGLVALLAGRPRR